MGKKEVHDNILRMFVNALIKRSYHYSPGTRGTKICLKEGTREQVAKKDQGAEGQWHSWALSGSWEKN